MRFLVLCFSVLATVALALSGEAFAAMDMSHMHMGHTPKTACNGTALRCARTATAAFAPSGTLFLVWDAGGRISVGKSTDLGTTVTMLATLPKTALPLDDGPDSRPKIAISPDGKTIAVTFTSRDAHYNGHAFVTRSEDGGKTFSPPQPITTGSPSQRFEVPAFDRDGRLFIAWLDKRDVAPARAAGKAYPGAALAYKWEDGAGGTVVKSHIAHDDTCECCRISVAFAGPGRPAVLFRNIFGADTRDHAVITFANPTTPGPLYRVADDESVIDACPHQGPSLSIGPNGTYHAAWLALGKVRKGLFYARSLDGGAHFSTPMPLGNPADQNSRPYVLATADAIYLVYKAFDGDKTRIELMVSHDDGATWSKPRAVASTSEDSDHPLLIANGNAAYLSWLTNQDGYRLIPLEAKR